MAMYIWVQFYAKLRQAIFFLKIEKRKKKYHFLTFLPFLSSSAPERFFRMSPGFIMSGEVQAIRSTYVPNSTV